MLLCLGTSTVVADLRQAGTLACVRNRLKMSVMSASVVLQLKRKIELLCHGCTVVSGWVSGMHQPEGSLYSFGLMLNPQTRVCVHCKAPFDEEMKRGRYTNDPGSNIDSSGLIDSGWLQILWHGAVIPQSLITAFFMCLVTHVSSYTQGYEGDQTSSGEGEGGGVSYALKYS